MTLGIGLGMEWASCICLLFSGRLSSRRALFLAIVTGRAFGIQTVVDGRAARNSSARGRLFDRFWLVVVATGCLLGGFIGVARQKALFCDGGDTFANLGGRRSLGVEAVKDGASGGRRRSRSCWHGDEALAVWNNGSVAATQP